MLLNDSTRFVEFRQELKPYIVRIADTASTREIDQKRLYMLADWAVRVIAPRALRSAKREEDALKLEACVPIVDKATAQEGSAAAAAYAAYAYAAKRELWDSCLKMLDELIKCGESRGNV